MPHTDASSRPPAFASGGVTAARRVAADVFADLRHGMLLDAAFDRRAGGGGRDTGLDARDRRWTQELLWGTLRRRAWIDAALASRVRGGLARLDADVTDLLRLGAYQLLYMGSVPAYAAIAQTVELAKQRHGIGASKLVNAVLRRLDRERDTAALTPPPHVFDDPAELVDTLALYYSHPRWLVARWVARFGAADAERLLAANNTEAPVVVRPYGVSVADLEVALGDAGVPTGDAPDSVTLTPGSIQLAPGASLIELGAFRQGLFFVQDPASTLVTQYAAFPAGGLVADVCAAPGGKSLELSQTASTVLAGDRSWTRLQRVVANVRRVNAWNVIAYVGDARQLPLAAVDGVLVDAPCTGTGTFRRHPDARWRLRVSDLAVMGALQREILRAAAAAVRPGGLLVYSTCSLEPEENDAQVDAFLADRSDFALEPPPPDAVPAAVSDGGRLRVLPHQHGVDGSFAARLRRAA